jgi:hypothetical protein
MNQCFVALIFSVYLLCPLNAASGQAQPHEYSLTITDLTSTESPIKGSGVVVIDEKVAPDSVEEKSAFNLTLKNTSSKPIVAYEVVIVVTPVHGSIIRHRSFADFLFRQELEFAPGAVDSIKLELPNVATPSRLPSSSSQRKIGATFEVGFVQFDDGTIYGKSKWGDSLRQARESAIQQMEASVQAFQTSGDAGLRGTLAAALARPDIPKHSADVLRGIKQTLDSEGADAAVSQMNAFIAAAGKRKTLM